MIALEPCVRVCAYRRQLSHRRSSFSLRGNEEEEEAMEEVNTDTREPVSLNTLSAKRLPELLVPSRWWHPVALVLEYNRRSASSLIITY